MERQVFRKLGSWPCIQLASLRKVRREADQGVPSQVSMCVLWTKGLYPPNSC